MIYMFLANGFEEVEALTPLDLLRRAGVEVKTVGVGSEFITGAHGITVKADMLDKDFSDEAPDMVILPGGMPGTTNLDASDALHSALSSAVASNARIAAICAAPMILGKLGLLKGKKATSYPGFEKYLDGAEFCPRTVVTDGNITTAAGMGVALDFGLELVSLLRGKDTAESLRDAVIAR